MLNLNMKQWIQISSTILLFVAGDVGDFIQSRPPVLACKKFNAILDNSIHIIIGLMSWTVVNPTSMLNCDSEFILIGIGSSVIDLDHFLAAKSFRISDAMHAPYRGILHCSGILLIVALLLGYFNQSKWMLILLVSFIPHHLRDSIRRGLYLFPPYIHSTPLPIWIVRLILIIFPWIIWLIKTKVIHSKTNVNHPLKTFMV